MQHWQGWDSIQSQVECYRSVGGTGPILLRVNSDQIDGDAPAAPINGTLPSLLEDFARARALGVDEVIWDLSALADLEPRRQAHATGATGT